MVALFATCPAAAQMLQSNGDLKRKWTNAVEWLNDELERRPYPTNAQYGYNNWSPPAQSNETTNGYFLERSHTARITLAKAFELCPDEDIEDQDMSEDGESPPPEEKVQSWQGSSPSVPQHPSPPPPAPSDSGDPSPKAPVLSSSEPLEEPLEPAFLSSNNESSSDTQHTSDSTSSSVTTTVSPTTVVLGDETTSSTVEKRRVVRKASYATGRDVKLNEITDEETPPGFEPIESTTAEFEVPKFFHCEDIARQQRIREMEDSDARKRRSYRREKFLFKQEWT